MLTKASTGETLEHLTQWLKKESWAEIWNDFWFKSLEEIGDALDLTPDEMMAQAAEVGFESVIVGALFERFMAVEFEEAPHNFIEDYLSRRGWKEPPLGRAYLEALRITPFSIYEVVDVVPGESATVQDLIRPYSPIRVLEKTGTQQMHILDHLMAKVVTLEGEHYFSGALLNLPRTSAERRAREILQAIKLQGVSLAKSRFQKEENLSRINETLQAFTLDMILDGFDCLFSSPKFVNAEGHPILFTEIRFPVKNKKRVLQVLDARQDFVRAETDKYPFWNWLLLDKPNRRVAQAGEVGLFQSELETEGGEFLSVWGTLELTPKSLLCETTSKERADILVPLLQKLLKEAIGKPTITHQSMESIREKVPSGKSSQKLDLAPEEQQEIIQEYLHQHYRDTLEAPLPMLKGKTPREAAKTKTGKPNVVKWLRALENGHFRNENLPPYEFGWMWQELGIADLKPE